MPHITLYEEKQNLLSKGRNTELSYKLYSPHFSVGDSILFTEEAISLIFVGAFSTNMLFEAYASKSIHESIDY